MEPRTDLLGVPGRRRREGHVVDRSPSSTPGKDPHFVGRSTELDLFRCLVAPVPAAGPALVLTGQPGIGKTALLDAAARLAGRSGLRVLRADDVRSEADVSYAALHALLLPLLDELSALPGALREALAGAVGLADVPAAGRLVVAAAVSELLRRHDGPVLLVVDDLQWLDGASAGVLALLARRLHGRRVRLLGAARTGSECLLLRAGLPRHDVGPLDAAAAETLLDQRDPTLHREVRERLLQAAQGHPLALLDLPAALTERQRCAAEPLPAVLALTSRLEAAFGDRLNPLSNRTRQLLLLAALEGTADLRTLSAVASEDRWLDGLAPAERDGLVRVDVQAQEVVLCHPLIGAAVVQGATSSERRRAHAALADALVDSPERCAAHLAQAVAGPDEAAAGLLERAARRALRRGEVSAAVGALRQAADRSPEADGRARRLALAAYVGADAAGDLRSVPHLLREARRARPRGVEAVLAVELAAAHHVLNGDGDVVAAHRMLVASLSAALAEGGPEGGLGVVEEALHVLLVGCHAAGRDEPWRPVEQALARLGPDMSPVLRASALSYTDPARAGTRDVRHLAALVSSTATDADPTRVVRVAVAASHLDLLPGCHEALVRVVRDGRDGGAVASAIDALALLAHEALVGGHWDEATQLAEEALTWADALGYMLVRLPAMACLALVAAARGDEEATRSLTQQLLDWAAPRRVTAAERVAHRARGVAALGRGDVEEAFEQLSGVSPAGELSVHVPDAMLIGLDLVEAAVRTGRTAEARAHLAAMRRRPVFALRPRLALLTAGAEALVAPDDQADVHFQRALAIPDAGRYPFEHARVQLAYGEHLRRRRATRDCRRQLSAALLAFEHLGAGPWAGRAEQELRASGATRRSTSDPSGSPVLTPQEQTIASLAASGLSNKQIAARLYLSPRTVGTHLYQVFPKLGITSRAALRDALTQAQAGAPTGALDHDRRPRHPRRRRVPT
jgi:DNA-binding CsgD family transcriptional regulator